MPQSNLTKALLETANDMHSAGLIGDETYRRITVRHPACQDDGAEHPAEASIITLSAKDSEAFVAAVFNPREPSEEMRSRVADYMARRGKHQE